MSEIVNTVREKATFLKLDGNNCVSKNRGCVVNMFDMFLQESWKFDHVDEVNDCKLQAGN